MAIFGIDENMIFDAIISSLDDAEYSLSENQMIDILNTINKEMPGIIALITQNLSEKFNETPKSTTIFESKKWANFYEKITLIINNSDKSVESDWAKYFNTLFGGMTPEQRRSRLILKIPANKIAMEKYTKLYNEFIQYKNQIPDNKEVFLKIHSLVKQLSEVSLSFEDDAPESVKKFFEQTNYGASLEYLTEDVMTWLRDKDLLSSYVVRAKGQ